MEGLTDRRGFLTSLVRTPARWWRSSLPLRVIGATLALSTTVFTLCGFWLVSQASSGVIAAKEQSAAAEAAVATETARRQLVGTDVDVTPTSETLLRITTELADRSTYGGHYLVMVQGSVGGTFISEHMAASSVPESIRGAIMRTTDSEATLVTPTSIEWSDGGRAPEPGLVVAKKLPDVDGAVIYFVYPLTQEQQTLDVLRRAVVTTGVLLIGFMALIAWVVTREVVRPVREARKAAERLASGFLDDRMTVRGTDDLASLASSMNHMATEIQAQIKQLEDLSAVQQRFVSDVSHELRTPLTTVRMAADMLFVEREEFDPVTRRSAELLHTELERFERLLSDLLEISRFDAGAAQLTLEQTDVVALAQHEIDAQRAFAEEMGSTLTLHATESQHAEIDPRRVQRILRNLVSNAIEHGEGGPIEVHVAGDAEAVAVAVRDHGVGFEPSQTRQVFHRFWRADPARVRRVGGSGLGLAISMEDARLHGGWLNAWGRPGQGAQFRVTLPRTAGAVLQVSPLSVVPSDVLEATRQSAAHPAVALTDGSEEARP